VKETDLSATEYEENATLSSAKMPVSTKDPASHTEMHNTTLVQDSTLSSQAEPMETVASTVSMTTSTGNTSTKEDYTTIQKADEHVSSSQTTQFLHSQTRDSSTLMTTEEMQASTRPDPPIPSHMPPSNPHSISVVGMFEKQIESCRNRLVLLDGIIGLVSALLVLLVLKNL